MNKITPDTMTDPNVDELLISFLKGFKMTIDEVGDYFVIHFKDGDNRMGKMEYKIHRSTFQKNVYVLMSYNFDNMMEGLSQFKTKKGPIQVIDNYVRKFF